MAQGRALNDLARECLLEIEAELDGHARAARLKRFVALTRDGKSVSQASRTIGVSREYANRLLKIQLVGLLAEKMQSKLRCMFLTALLESPAIDARCPITTDKGQQLGNSESAPLLGYPSAL